LGGTPPVDPWVYRRHRPGP